MFKISVARLCRFAAPGLLALTVHAPARAEIWPGTEPSPGGAIAAKVIGQQCSGILENSEIRELVFYIAQKTKEFEEGPPDAQRYPVLFPRLEQMYRELYAEPRRCDAEAAAMARDMLERVRRSREKPSALPQ